MTACQANSVAFLVQMVIVLICLLQINHNQSLEVQFPIAPAFAGSQASRRRLLSWLYEDNIANDNSNGYIPQQHSLPGHRSMLVNESQVIDALGDAGDAIDSAAGSVDNAIDEAIDVLHHGIPSRSSQNYSSINGTGLWFGYNVSFLPHEMLHEHYNLTHDNGNQTATSGLWFGYDVQHRPEQSVSNYGNFTPRYIGGHNQVLGGLYIQQVCSTRSTLVLAFLLSRHLAQQQVYGIAAWLNQ